MNKNKGHLSNDDASRIFNTLYPLQNDGDAEALLILTREDLTPTQFDKLHFDLEGVLAAHNFTKTGDLLSKRGHLLRYDDGACTRVEIAGKSIESSRDGKRNYCGIFQVAGPDSEYVKNIRQGLASAGAESGCSANISLFQGLFFND